MKSTKELIKNKYQIGSMLCLMFVLVSFTGCKKYLDQKPNKSDIIPTNLEDLQSLLDNRGAIASRGTGGYSELVADNYYIPASNWVSLSSSNLSTNQYETQNHIWGNLPHDNYWNLPYLGPIYYSNVVLDQLPLVTVKPTEDEKYNNIKGAALFYRAFAFEGLAQLFCKPYSNENFNEPGIVLKLSSSASEKKSRGTVQQTYDRIIADLTEASALLPEISTVPLALRARPSRQAAYAALARTYLSMRDYTNAGLYANKVLQQYNKLMNYYEIQPAAGLPSQGRPPLQVGTIEEVIFHQSSPTYTVLNAANHRIDPALYQSYESNDLRKIIFFAQAAGGTYTFRGSYNGTATGPFSVFDGLATDEMYLIRAECAARAGDKDAAMNDLNNLLRTRWKKINGVMTYIDQTATDAGNALSKILMERRKELVFRGLRWSDIRRLNIEGANITITRNIGGNPSLPPNDNRTVMLITLSEIDNNPNVQQNPR